MNNNDDTVFHPSGAIFDMDGLMLDTERPIVPLWIEAGKKYGVDIDPDLVSRTIGLNGGDIRALCLRELGAGFPYDTFHEYLNALIVQEFEKGIGLKPGLIQLLDHFSALKVPLAVATSSRRESAIWKLRKTGIFDRFAAVAGGDEVKRGKPEPDVFLLAAEKLGQPPSLCVGFEDSPAGLLALHTAGIRSVFVKDVVEPPHEVLSTVWRRCNNLAEAVDLFV